MTFRLDEWARAQDAPLRDAQSGRPICWGPRYTLHQPGACEHCTEPADPYAASKRARAGLVPELTVSVTCRQGDREVTLINEMEFYASNHDRSAVEAHAANQPERRENPWRWPEPFPTASALLEWLDTPHKALGEVATTVVAGNSSRRG